KRFVRYLKIIGGKLSAARRESPFYAQALFRNASRMAISFGPYFAMSSRKYSSVTRSAFVQYRISYSCSRLIKRRLRKTSVSLIPDIVAQPLYPEMLDVCQGLPTK